MTHRYTLLIGATVLTSVDQPAHSAIAWAEGIVLVVGTEAQVRGASRGDSEVVDLGGAYVVPIGPADSADWPPTACLEIGGPADLAIVDRDPRSSFVPPPAVIALVRGGHAVRGRLPVAR